MITQLRKAVCPHYPQGIGLLTAMDVCFFVFFWILRKAVSAPSAANTTATGAFVPRRDRRLRLTMVG